ncbi:YraN family protein, partial [bacterium]|nr:YraN family protein [bacterium]
KIGEDLAMQYLVDKGFSVIHRNYRLPIGEIDLVAKKKDTIYFTEVKTRKDEEKGTPLEAISASKISTLKKLAEWYLAKENPDYKDVSLAAIGVCLNVEPPEILFIPDITS